MNKLESIKLFQDIQLVSEKYKHLELENNKSELEVNLKLQSLIQFYKSKIDELKSRANFISRQTRDELKNSNSKDIYKASIDLNNFAHQKYNALKESNIDSIAINLMIQPTIDELILVNDSIRNKDYLKNKNTYFYIYEKIVTNAFMIFLALKDMDMEQDNIHNLSQGILSQIQTLSIISM